MTREEELEMLRSIRAENEARERREEREAFRDRAIAHLTVEQQVTSTKIDNMNTLWNERFSGLSSRVEANEKALSDTGKHIIDDNAMKQAQRILELQDANEALVAANTEKGTWLKRQALQLGAGAVGAIALVIIGVVITRVFGGK